RPILDIVERLIADLERLINWKFTPPIELHALGARLQPTGRVVRVSRLDESLRGTFAQARRLLLPVREPLRDATRRRRGRKAGAGHPFRVSVLPGRTAPPKAARRRDLERLLRDELLRLHPDREKHHRAAQAEVGRLAHHLSRAILAKPRAR